MYPDSELIVLDRPEGSGVVAIVEAGEPSDDLLRRAMNEAVARSGELIVIQLVDDASAVRRALAKALLTRDVTWWSRDQVGVSASVEVLAEESVDGAVGCVRAAACVVTTSSIASSGRGVTLLQPALSGVGA